MCHFTAFSRYWTFRLLGLMTLLGPSFFLNNVRCYLFRTKGFTKFPYLLFTFLDPGWPSVHLRNDVPPRLHAVQGLSLPSLRISKPPVSSSGKQTRTEICKFWQPEIWQSRALDYKQMKTKSQLFLKRLSTSQKFGEAVFHSISSFDMEIPLAQNLVKKLMWKVYWGIGARFSVPINTNRSVCLVLVWGPFL